MIDFDLQVRQPSDVLDFEARAVSPGDQDDSFHLLTYIGDPHWSWHIDVDDRIIVP